MGIARKKKHVAIAIDYKGRFQALGLASGNATSMLKRKRDRRIDISTLNEFFMHLKSADHAWQPDQESLFQTLLSRGSQIRVIGQIEKNARHIGGRPQNTLPPAIQLLTCAGGEFRFEAMKCLAQRASLFGGREAEHRSQTG